MPTATANGIDIYFERRGSGPRLLYLNGSGATLDRTRVMLDGFAARFDLLSHDQRGLGRTEIPEGPYEMADYAADAVALLDVVGWDRCRVVGVSFGGMVAQELAVTWPERVERLALLCTSPGGAYPPAEIRDRAPSSEPTLLDTRFTPEWLATHDADRALIDALVARDAQHSTPEQRRGELEQLGARSRLDCPDRLGAITCTTLVASGRYDGISPLSNAEAIAARIPDAELRVYEGGHTFMVQDRTAVPEVMAFLAE